MSVAGRRAGVLLGTAAYRSPEQARGQPLDARTDIWSFGCVLYQLLTGRTAFGGAMVTDILSAIVSREPDWIPLPAETPAEVRSLLRRCLAKDVKRRLRHIGDARIVIEDASTSGPPAPVAHARSRGERLAWMMVAVLLAAFAWTVSRVIGGPSPLENDAPAVSRILRLTSGPAHENGPAISPDGKWVMNADGGGARLLVTAEVLDSISWSRDGSRIAYAVPGDDPGLRTVAVADGSVQSLPTPGPAAAPAWSPRDDVIGYLENTPSVPVAPSH